jgi:hypothetical protein
MDRVLARLAEPDAADLLAPPEADLRPVLAEADEVQARLDALALDFADGVLTASQLRVATDRLRTRKSELEALMGQAARSSEFAPLLQVESLEEAWEGMPIDARRRLVSALMTVTLRPAPRGVHGFDPASVLVEWRTA